MTEAAIATVPAGNAPDPSAIPPDELARLTDDIVAALKTVYDPEIPVNIVDLGLVYDLILGKSESGATTVNVKMTLTAPGCGMGPTIAADARSRILTVPGVESAEVDLVWSPPWNQGMITEAGRMKLGLV